MYLELQVERQAGTRKNIRQTPPYPYRGHRRWLLRQKKTIIFAINRTWRILKIRTKVLSKTQWKELRAALKSNLYLIPSNIGSVHLVRGQLVKLFLIVY